LGVIRSAFLNEEQPTMWPSSSWFPFLSSIEPKYWRLVQVWYNLIDVRHQRKDFFFIIFHSNNTLKTRRTVFLFFKNKNGKLKFFYLTKTASMIAQTIFWHYLQTLAKDNIECANENTFKVIFFQFSFAFLTISDCNNWNFIVILWYRREILFLQLSVCFYWC